MNAEVPERGRPQGGTHGGGAPAGRPPGGTGRDTRARIQQVALELFAEQGYEGTSLREIAERLGVTKAALYYHFKSKEDIVRSFTEDHFARVDALIAWAKEQPPSPGTRHEILARYFTILIQGTDVFRFLERNQAVLRSQDEGKQRFEQFRPRLSALVALMIGPDAPLRAQVRATAALFSISTSHMFLSREQEVDPDELRKLVLEAADDLTRDLGSW